jgi:3-oxoacyl-[acyl-carrier protein] reductase
MDLGLKGTKAFVAGGSKGLGLETAIKLSEEGAQVAINARNADRLNDAALKIEKVTSQKPLIYPGDLTEPKIVNRIITEAADVMGGLDLLVTNTGGPPPGKFEEFDDEDWQSALDLVFFAHLRLIRAALPFLKNSQRASVLTITSISVKQPVPNLILSNAGRGATIGLTKSLALELGEQNIRFNSILPTYMETERVIGLLTHRAKTNETTLDAEIEKQSADSPLGRMGTPAEFANAAVFLLSPAASYLTGNMLSVDGGMYKGIF